jgi:hypothetical protein
MVALGWQALIISQYIYSAVLDPNWESFVHLYGVEAPAKGPERFCFDYCAPKLPFLFGWTGIGCFFAGLISLTIIWWKPNP